MIIETLQEMLSRTKIKTVNKEIFAKNTYYYSPMVTIPTTLTPPDSGISADNSGV